MNEVEDALSQIADIHARLAASTRFRGFAPEAVALTGMLALAGTAAQLVWPEELARDASRYVAVWVIVAIAACTIVGSETLIRSRRLHGRLADHMIESALRQFVPFGAGGALVTFVICSVSPATAWVLPGLWQILIALAGFTAGPSLPRAIIWPAGWYLLCGTVVLAITGQEGSLSPWIMGIPFGIGQIAIAFTLRQAADDDHGGR